MRVYRLSLRVGVFLVVVCQSFPLAWALGPETSQLPMPGRVRGMAGAVTALADPHLAPLVQPASISYLDDKKYLHMPQLLLDYTSGFATFFNALDERVTVANMVDAANNQPDHYQHLGLSTLAGVFEKNLAYGAITEFLFDAYYDSAGALHHTNYFTNTIFATMGKEFGSDKELSFGITTKLSHRMGPEKIYTAAEFTSQQTLGLGDTSREGLGLGFDAGLLYQKDLGENFVFSAGVAALNIGNLVYFIRTSILDPVDGANPRALDMQLNSGVSVLWKTAGTGSWRFSLDVKHLTRWDEVELLNHFAIGTEYRFPKWISLLGGMEGLGWSGGILVRFWTMNLSFIGYNEEVGRRFNESKKSFRWMFEAKVFF